MRTFLGLLLLLIYGCSNSPVVPVSGIVTYQGKPVCGLFIHFLAEDGRPSWGYTDEQGRFTLRYSREEAGALIGRHKVFFTGVPRSLEEEMAGPIPRSSEVLRVLAKYGSADTSTLELEITAATSELKIELND